MPRRLHDYGSERGPAAYDEVEALARSTTTTTSERENFDFARDRAALERLAVQRERLRAITEDGLGSVSDLNFKSDAQRLIDLDFIADRLSAETDTMPVERANSYLPKHDYSRPRFDPDEVGQAYAGRVRPNKQQTNNHRQVSRNSDIVPRTVFGTDAWITRSTSTSRRMSSGGQFYSRSLTVPCIQRDARKQVLFARNKAGKGHKGKRRPSKYGNIWC